ncbi:hypothetical protein CBER1_04481 [Cercospora berteroae]|uniref:F-box domain-containing protein n=1 Tax=Cercospora berteroae TaxID=357750 RepID=A0A2S6CF09_9PEZI|nr:hypothetical protein CBER1_04481 [Cercospora berteroae]
MASLPPSQTAPTKPSPLRIAELLEEIILYLPLRDILLCQRIDTTFRSVVQGSSQLRKVLFLEPATNKPLEYCPPYFEEDGLDHEQESEVSSRWKNPENGEAVHLLFNPFLMSLFITKKRFWQWAPFDEFTVPFSTDREHISLAKHSSRLIISEPGITKTARIRTPYLGKTVDSSYRGMLITHPPCTSLEANYVDRRLFGLWRDTVVDYSGVGVRFGQLLETVGGAVSQRLAVFASGKSAQNTHVEIDGAQHWRFFPESVLDHVIGWEMLALMNNPKNMTDDIDRIITARKKWDYAAVGKSNDENEQKGPFAWEEETVNQGDPFETMAADFGVCLNSLRFFLEPATSKTIELGYDHAVRPLFNPFLMSIFAKEERFWEFKPIDTWVSSEWMDCGEEFGGAIFADKMRNLIISEPWIAKAAEICTGDLLDLSGRSYSRMLVTHPSFRKIETRPWDRNLGVVANATVVEDSSVGIRFGSLLKAVLPALNRQLRMSTAVNPHGPMQMSRAGVERWRFCPESVLDHVTGGEMLAIMDDQLHINEMNDEINRIIRQRKEWDQIVGWTSKDDEIHRRLCVSEDGEWKARIALTEDDE